MARHADRLHENMVREKAVLGPSDRSFGSVFAGFFSIVAAFSAWNAGRHWPFWLVAAVIFAVVSAVAPKLLGPLNRLWTRFGLLLHRILNPVVMGIIFFAVVTPIALLMRILGKRPISLDFDPAATTYWISRSQSSTGSMKQQF